MRRVYAPNASCVRMSRVRGCGRSIARLSAMRAGPARMADDFAIELPHPRTLDLKTHETFGGYTRRIYKLLGME